MVERTPTIVRKVEIPRYLMFETPVSTNDTVPISDFILLIASALFKISDGSAVAHTKATNIITITEAGLTDEKVAGFVMGVA